MMRASAPCSKSGRRGRGCPSQADQFDLAAVSEAVDTRRQNGDIDGKTKKVVVRNGPFYCLVHYEGNKELHEKDHTDVMLSFRVCKIKVYKKMHRTNIKRKE